jgi:hypothetical protein
VEALLTPALARLESAAAQGAALYQTTVEPNDGRMGWPEGVFISVGIAAGCALVAVIVWQVFLTARKSIDTKAREEGLEEMRALTQRSIAANEATANELAKLSQGVTDLRVRLGDIEKVLREVE